MNNYENIKKNYEYIMNIILSHSIGIFIIIIMKNLFKYNDFLWRH